MFRGADRLDSNCPACGKRLKDLKAWTKHAARCKKLRIQVLSYSIPVVAVEDLPLLKPKLLPSDKEWGIWNPHVNDWLRDQGNEIDGRLFERNAKSLLNCVIAKSLVVAATKPATRPRTQ